MMNGLDLFSGIGGLTLALAPWVKPVAYCECEKYAAAVLFNRMSDGLIPKAPIFPDIRKLTGAILPSIDIIYGGFPCQDVSCAGLRKGLDGERTGLFREAIRLVRECRPKFVFLENVPGIRKYVPTVRQELEALGYDCRDGFLSAAEVGANHKRNRWWLLANSQGEGVSRGQRGLCDTEWGSKSREIRESIVASESMADTDKQIARRLPIGKEPQNAGTSCGSQTSNPESERLQNWPTIALERQEEVEEFKRSNWWSTEPNVGRVANGISYRVDRLRGLGNAVVPAQAREAFKRLMGL